ncbi:lipoprotein-releasing ABC transporter ATP-binding protein LolD [Marinicella rhabdoformis]|uniref:lipoprotein-releasing ABC transporter ATP-binding protein LolD n=1 Tax=Marinicella rhabdoformis TaxID=2580566 RepID=UPI0012AECDA8|nr:lipoprotein-releasing ABC transporter ATP-binding protein LolD [Marinicella rhabdoformis]
MSDVILSCQQLAKTYQDGEKNVQVFKDLNFAIKSGESVAIMGASGSGKSTLMHLLGGLDHATAGQILLKGKDLSKLSANKRGMMRNQHLGFVYQFHHLLPEFTALENVMMPLLIAKKGKKEAAKIAADTLKQVGLSERLTHRPAQLSGGERQRAAIARALVMQPDCILADEPTGNLDEKTAQSVMDMFLELNQANNTALILVTHDMAVAQQMQKIYELRLGDLHPYSGN